MEYLDNTGRQRLGDALKDAIGEDARLSIIASYFTVHAYGDLKEELSKVRELRFVFDQPTFLRRMQSEKEPHEWEIQRRSLRTASPTRFSTTRTSPATAG